MDVIDKEVSSCLGEGKVFPPGFRFHPTDEELVLYYLKRKMCHRRLRLDVIAETDVYKWEPEELPGISKLRTGDRQWFFISPRDRKYPNAARSNRATRHGYWKATGKDRIILYNSRNVGVKKTLVFYKGRAPTGERTDWVMHEYTMDEEELKRCPSVKDYYALYKVYKKSGPGPKNGEQYGAPFNEEEWADEGLDAKDLAVPENNVKHVETAIYVPDNCVNRQVQSHEDGYEEFMNSIASEPISVQPPALDHEFSLAELSGDVNVLVGEEASFGIPQSGVSHVKLHESLEVKSTAKSHISQQSNVFGDLQDFLEMDDLICQENAGRPNQISENVSLDEFFDGLEEFDVYKDTLEILSQSEAGGQGLNSQVYMKNLDNGVANPVSDFSNEDFLIGTANIEQAYLWNRDDTNILQRSFDQRRIVYTPSQAQAHQGIIPFATTGVVHDNQSGGSTKNNSSKQEEDEGKDSWFLSSIWAFVESIPTTPASAAESPLVVVNPTFERNSSFSKLRTNSNTLGVAAVRTPITSINSGKRKMGLLLLCFSLFGILCAILWMFII